MQSRNAFGSFYPVDSAVHRLNPVVKLINFILCIIVLSLTNNLYINIFMLALVIIMMFLSYVPIRFYFKTIWSLRYIYILIAFICFYFNQTLTETLIYTSKLITVVEYLNILVYTTSPSETVYGIELFLTPFNFLFLPLGKIAYSINKTLRYIPNLQTVEHKALKAAASRGIDYYHANIFKRLYATLIIGKNLFKINKQRNIEIDKCSKYRLYNVRKHRTNYKTNKIGFYDIAFISFHLLIIFAYISIRGISWDT